MGAEESGWSTASAVSQQVELDSQTTSLGSHRALAGTRVGPYRIESLIARGGMSEVYKAVDVKLGRPVALKLLPPFMADTETARDLFLREARIAASLEHPNVVPIYDAGRRDGVLWIAMRYIAGTDLHSLIEEHGRLSTRRTLLILKQIAGALDAAHDAGLVHRDVKPQNILIIPAKDRRSRDQAFLSDFGLAKALDSGSRSTSRAFIGTVNYVSPEQIRNNPVDRRSDIYSLGCVLYECLTGTVPFERDSDVSVLWAHVEEPVRPASASRRGIPSSVDAVIERALAKAPEERFSNCGELISAYRSALRQKRATSTRASSSVTSDDPDVVVTPARFDNDRGTIETRRWVRSLATSVMAIMLGASGVYALTRVIAPASNIPPARAAGDVGGAARATIDKPAQAGRAGPRRDAEATTGRREGIRDSPPSLNQLTGFGAVTGGTPVDPSLAGSGTPAAAAALTRTVTGEYTGAAPDGLGPADCVADNTVGCVMFEARADEHYLGISVSDKLGGSIRAWIRQNYDSDPNYDGEWSMVCNESEKAIRIVPGAEINILIQRGECGDGSASRPSAGIVTASFYSRRP